MFILWTVLIIILAALSVKLVIWASYGLPLLLRFSDHVIDFCQSVSTRCVEYLDVVHLVSVWAGISLFACGMLYGAFRSAQGLVRARRALSRLPVKHSSRDVVLIEDDRAVAFTHGLLRPRIYLSRGLFSLDRNELKSVFFHEMHHKRNMDPLFFFFLNFIGRAFFYIPVIKKYVRVVHARREQSADDAAMGLSKDPLSLASALINISFCNRDVRVFQAPFVGKSHGDLASRIRRIIEGVRARPAYPPLRKNVPSVLISAFLMAILLWPMFADFTGARGCASESCPMHTQHLQEHGEDYCKTHCEASEHSH